MRLRVLVQRNALPPVTIVHSTGAGPLSHTKSPTSTIADFLLDINDLVPLESADGEWGLEDYVVEVAATADQELTYECLHFQTIESVLREDDKVVVRALDNNDLRLRRLGGRHQITSDGRHLIDGVSFGKRRLREAHRPRLTIPPRKKRRMLGEDQNETENEEIAGETLQSESGTNGYTTAMVPYVGGEDEDDDDEDFTDHADAESEEENDLLAQIEGEEFSSEIRQLLEEAAEVEQGANLAIAHEVLDRRLKRKRSPENEIDQDQNNDVFEGFSSPKKVSQRSEISEPADQNTNFFETSGSSSKSKAVSPSTKRITDSTPIEKQVHKQIVLDNTEKSEDSDDSEATSGSDPSEDDSEADSLMEEIAMKQAKQRALNLINRVLDDDETSSSGSDFEDDDDDEVSDSSAESSSGSGSDSDDSSESDSSSSSDSESESEAEPLEHSPRPTTTKKTPLTQITSSTRAELEPQAGIPFEGTTKTHQNNNRVKRRKKLNALKRQGLLPPEADFAALAQYEAQLGEDRQHSTASEIQILTEEQNPAGHLSGDDALMTENLDSASELTSKANKENIRPAGAEAMSPPQLAAKSANIEPEIPETSQPEPESSMEPASKRARLDIASSRRMILGSLGVRVPKTAEQEQKLREKFARDVRPLKQYEEPATKESPYSSQLTTEQSESWLSKLVITAVECENPQRALPPPPFPFQQGWTKPNKRKLRDQSQYYQGRDDSLREGPAVEPALSYDDAPSGDQVSGLSSYESQRAAKTSVPKNIDDLPSLTKADLRAGARIAYQELHVDASTNYEPGISPYRVGEISQVLEDGNVCLQLIPGTFGRQAPDPADPEANQHPYGKFELPDDDAEEDDGAREVSFDNMIKPRLIQPSPSVQVPDSNSITGLRGGDLSSGFKDDDTAIVPESEDQNIELQPSEHTQSRLEIDTPRQREINGLIKEAGFESALDEQLLLPITVPACTSGEPGNDEAAVDQSQGSYAHRFRRRSPGAAITSSSQQPSSAIESSLLLRQDLATSARSSPGLPPSSLHKPSSAAVEYPHISQIDINSSAPATTANDSSFQEAQVVTPTPAPGLSLSLTDHEGPTGVGTSAAFISQVAPDQLHVSSAVVTGSTDDGHASQEPSSPMEEPEIEQTQIPQISSDLPSSPITTPDDEGSSVPQDSFLDERGYGGNDSSYHDGSLDDSDSPSLSELTQPRRTSRRTSSRVTKKSISPPATRKSRRSTNDVRKQKSSPTPLSSPQPPTSSQPYIKPSQSQREVALSQIPAVASVVDLTSSSDPMSPIESSQARPTDDESDYVASGRIENVVHKNGTRRTGGRRSKQVSQESGIGKRTLLTRKRDTESKYY
jgi:hypothetical protein